MELRVVISVMLHGSCAPPPPDPSPPPRRGAGVVAAGRQSSLPRSDGPDIHLLQRRAFTPLHTTTYYTLAFKILPVRPSPHKRPRGPSFSYKGRISLIEGRLSRGHFRKTEAGCGARARMNAIRSRAALGHRSAGKKTGPHGACLTQGAKHLVRRALRKPGSGAEPSG